VITKENRTLSTQQTDLPPNIAIKEECSPLFPESKTTDSPVIPAERPYEYLDPFLENETEKYCSEDLSLTEVTTVTVDGESTADEAEGLDKTSADREEQSEIRDGDSSVSPKSEEKEEIDTSSDTQKAEFEDYPVPERVGSTLEDIPSFGNSGDEYLEDVVEEELEHLIQSSGEEDLVRSYPAEVENAPQRNELSTLLDNSGEHQGLLVNEPDHVHVFFRITYFDSKF